jgi:flagellar biosynthesis/type III secretory pathway chaperone
MEKMRMSQNANLENVILLKKQLKNAAMVNAVMQKNHLKSVEARSV